MIQTFVNSQIPLIPMMLRVVCPDNYNEYTLSLRYANFIYKVDQIEDLCIITFADGEVLECYEDINNINMILQGFNNALIRRN